MKKNRKHTYQRLSSEQIKAFRDLREAQYIAWETRNTSRAHELGMMIAELRNSNLAYREL